MLFASWILIKLDMNGEEGLGTNPIQWRHDDVITDFTVGWLRTKNLVYTDIYMHFLFNLHASVCVVHAKHRRGVAPLRTALVHPMFTKHGMVDEIPRIRLETYWMMSLSQMDDQFRLQLRTCEHNN